MKERVIELANQVVIGTETIYLQGLLTDLQDAEHVSESCGCPSCRKRPEGVKERIQTELDRTSDPIKVFHKE